MAKSKVVQDEISEDVAAATTTERVKKRSPVTKEEFEENAMPLVIDIDGEKKVLSPKVFKTGSFGWHTNEKITVMIGDTPVKVQLNCNATVIGSKDLSEE